MKPRFNLSTQCRSSVVAENAASLGHANSIMFMCKRSSEFKIRTLFFWIKPAIDHKQILFFFDSTAKPIGYATWAHLATDTEQRLLYDPNFLLHPSEWNEGGRTWIIDFCFPCGGARETAQRLNSLLKDTGINQIFWARRNKDHTLKRIGNYRQRVTEQTSNTKSSKKDIL